MGVRPGDTREGYKCPAEVTSTIESVFSCLANIFVELGSRPIEGGLSHMYQPALSQLEGQADHATVCLLHVTALTTEYLLYLHTLYI